MFTSTLTVADRKGHRGRTWRRNRARTESPMARPGETAPIRDTQIFPGWMDDLIREMESEYTLIGKELSFR